MKRNSILMTLCILAALIFVSGCSVIDSLAATPAPTSIPVISAPPDVMAEGQIVPDSFTALSFAVRAEISTIPVKVGDHMEKDAILVSVGDRESMQAALDAATLAKLNAQQQLDALNRNINMARASAANNLAAASLAESEARSRLDEFISQDFRDKLDDAKENIEDAKVELADRKAKLDDYADLDQDNATRKNAQKRVDEATKKLHEQELKRDLLLSQRDQAQAALDLATAQREEAQRLLDALANGADKDELALANAALQSATSQLDAAQAALRQMDLRAPFDGTVMDIHDMEIGDVVNPGQIVVTFANIDHWYAATTDLTELEVTHLKIGQEVTLVLDAFPQKTLNGMLESISNTYSERSGDVLYTARVSIKDPPPDMRWGMTVNITFPE